MRGIGARLRVDTGGPVGLRSTHDPAYMRGKIAIEEDEPYIGAGNLALRQRASKWALSPAVNGDTTEIAVLNFARAYLQASKLPDIRQALFGIKTVVCDCKPGEPCHGAVFIDAASDDWLLASDQAFRDAPEAISDRAANKRPKGQGSLRSRKPKPAMALAAMANLRAASAVGIPIQPRQATFWPQATIEDAVRSFFPDERLGDDFPWLEDLVNSQHLASWRRRSKHEVVQSTVSTHAPCTHALRMRLMMMKTKMQFVCCSKESFLFVVQVEHLAQRVVDES